MRCGATVCSMLSTAGSARPPTGRAGPRRVIERSAAVLEEFHVWRLAQRLGVHSELSKSALAGRYLARLLDASALNGLNVLCRLPHNAGPY